MITIQSKTDSQSAFNKPFWVIWAIELWERFGYYGVQALLALYFVKQLGYSEAKSIYVFGSFSAFTFGFIWLGGWLGDYYLGAKRTIILGATTLMLSYAGLALANHNTIYYALAGIIVGNALFKANPSSLIAKMYRDSGSAIDGAMTLYYMAVNIGSMISISITPIISQRFGWSCAFWLCAIGLALGLTNFIFYLKILNHIHTDAGKQPLNLSRLIVTIVGSILGIIIIAQLLDNTPVCNVIVYTVVGFTFFYFLKIAFKLHGIARTRMLVAFILILQAVIFFVLYNQMPTSLIFFAYHNINNHIFGWTIPAAEYYALNPLTIIIMSPILAWLYYRIPSTHVTKFCIGMSLSACAFLVLALPQFTAMNGFASPLWMVLTYFLQSTGELLISGLGLAMVAVLCPNEISGFVMGVWWLTNMLAGPLGASVGALTAPENSGHLSALSSLHIYSHVFTEIGVVTGIVAIIMWCSRPALNKLLK